MPVMNGYHDGPALRDERRNKAVVYRNEAQKEWEGFFGDVTVARWDNFEDFFYLMAEKFVSHEMDLVKHCHWDTMMLKFYRKRALDCKDNKQLRELPEIAFSKNENYNGKIFDLESWQNLIMK